MSLAFGHVGRTMLSMSNWASRHLTARCGKRDGKTDGKMDDVTDWCGLDAIYGIQDTGDMIGACCIMALGWRS